MTLDDFAAEAKRLSDRIDRGVAALREQSEKLAAAERDYRQAKAEAWVTVEHRTFDDQKRLAAEIEAEVDGRCAEYRHARDLAEGMRQAALESVRSRRTQLSALQSLLAAHREEAGFARTEPREMAA